MKSNCDCKRNPGGTCCWGHVTPTGTHGPTVALATHGSLTHKICGYCYSVQQEKANFGSYVYSVIQQNVNLRRLIFDD